MIQSNNNKNQQFMPLGAEQVSCNLAVLLAVTGLFGSVGGDCDGLDCVGGDWRLVQVKLVQGGEPEELLYVRTDLIQQWT